MTGEKDRYTTVEKLYKIADETLATPAHDELIVKLLDPDYAARLFAPEVWGEGDKNYVFEVYLGEDRFDLEAGHTWNRANLEAYFQKDWVFLPGYNSKKMSGDHLKGRNCFFNGYYYENGKKIETARLSYDEVDRIFTECHCEAYCKNRASRIIQKTNILMNTLEKVSQDFIKYHYGLNIDSEIPIKARNGYIVGYWDIVIYTNPRQARIAIHPQGDKNLIAGYIQFKIPQIELYIEVKPKIASFGATLRQIRTYDSYNDNKGVILFTPDLTFKKQFESQGIRVVSPSDIIDI